MNYSVDVLTLFEETERQAKIKNNLDQLGIDFNFFKVRRNTLFNYPNFTMSETGCTISHLLLTEKFIREDIAFKVILEDDGIPTEKLNIVLSELETIYSDTGFDVILF